MDFSLDSLFCLKYNWISIQVNAEYRFHTTVQYNLILYLKNKLKMGLYFSTRERKKRFLQAFFNHHH